MTISVPRSELLNLQKEDANTKLRRQRHRVFPTTVNQKILTWTTLHPFDENIIDLMRDYPEPGDFYK